MNFAFKDKIKSLFPQQDANAGFLNFLFVNIASGGIAGGISLTMVYPLDFARTRLGADIGKGPGERQFKGLKDCFTKIIKTDGIRGLYRGYSISIIGIIPYRAAYFGLFDSGKTVKVIKENLLCKFLFAQMVTMTAGLVSYPFDTVRRRLMMQSGLQGGVTQQYTGTIDCFNKILKKEGSKAFFKGAFSNVLRGVGASMVLIFNEEF